MKILAGDPNGRHRDKALSLGCGCMIPCHLSSLPTPRFRVFEDTGLALDNGAFSCHSTGRPFDGKLFLRSVDRFIEHRLKMLFIVCPDMVMGGSRSIAFSESWRTDDRKGLALRLRQSKALGYDFRLAFVVQDGMHGDHLEDIIHNYQYLFIGGSVGWKWKHAFYWITWAHERGIPAHIGQCGAAGMLQAADRYNADSVDSTSWPQNNSWHIIEGHHRNAQQELGLPPMPMLVPPLEDLPEDTRWTSRRKTKQKGS